MTICAISDTHGQHESLDLVQYPADILVHAGDWTRGRDLDFSETIPFLDWLSAQPYEHIILIAGNHERTIFHSQDEFYSLLAQYPSITYLQDSSTIIADVEFYGSPYSNRFGPWAFMEEESDLVPIWDAIPDTTGVLITHGPAYGHHDMVRDPYRPDPHVGSRSLHARKLALSGTLQLHISGHIHEDHGVSATGTITNIGASVLDEHYQLTYEPTIIILKETP